MCRNGLLLLLCIVGYTLSQESVSVASIRRKKISKFKCDFTIVYTITTVNLEASSIKCTPKKPKKTNLKVTLVTKDKYKFITKINVNPTKIVEMEVVPPDTVITELFQEEYENITSEMPKLSRCGGYDENINGVGVRGLTKSTIGLWKNAEVNWAFVSNGDGYKNRAFHINKWIGVSKTDVQAARKAMKIIQDKTCIKFKLVKKPNKNEPWIVLFREAHCTASRCRCVRKYLASIALQELKPFGKPFYHPDLDWNSRSCMNGQYFFGLGTGKPSQYVISKHRIDKDDEHDIGLMVHELCHGLGLEHTHKRPDRDKYIKVIWRNIIPEFQRSYNKCRPADKCKTYGIPYDCESIMHYHDSLFSIKPGHLPTMEAINKQTCNLKDDNYKLRDSDVAMLKKMYCDTGGGTEPCTGRDCPSLEWGDIQTPNYPDNYPRNIDATWDLIVADGSRIELTFSDFAIENAPSCSWDYVEVLDSDNSQMLKTCGYTPPGVVTSTGNTMTVKFHSDGVVDHKGFKAMWKQVDASASSDQIKSIKKPNYPNSYTANLDEEYDVEVKAKITGDLEPHGRK